MKKIRRDTKRSVSCPYYPGAMNFAIRSVKRTGIKGVTLVPSILCNNRNSIFANLKDRRDLNCVKNASFCIRCKDCNFYDVLHAKRFDIQRKVNFYLKDPTSRAREHSLRFTHSIDVNVNKSDIFVHKSEIDLDVVKNII